MPSGEHGADAGAGHRRPEVVRRSADGRPTALFTCSLTGTVRAVSAALSRLSGRPAGELPGAPASTLLHPSSQPRLLEVLQAARKGAGSGAAELSLRHADGSAVDLAVSWSVLSGAGGDASQLVFLCADPTAGPGAERPVAAEPGSAVGRDGLTYLPNRTTVVEQLARALHGSERSTAVLLVDLDHFRMVNESCGHVAGDQLLSAVGARLRAVVCGHGTVGRFGGDEFLVVCEDTDEHRAHALASDLLEALTEPFCIDGAPVHVAASIGLAVARAGRESSATDLLRSADTAVHAAKGAGRGRVHVFDRALGEAVEQRSALSAELRGALASDSLHLEYQPIVDLASGRVVGMEALARWTHPERGPVPPSNFVSIAELTGLAPELDRWVVRRALHDMAALRAAGAVPDGAYVAVNLSATNLTDAFAFDDLVGWTDEFGLPADQLVLEITETAIMQNTELAVRLLGRLRDQGFRVAMDDFGTGYSSLAHLRDLPISALKVDRSFVADITDQRDALAITASIVDLGRAVGVDVVAEGVETPDQLGLLRQLGVATAQGWLWGPAVPLTRLLNEGGWTVPLSPASGTGVRTTTRRTQRDVSVAHGLKRLVELHQAGASVAAIAAALDAEGYRTPAGLRWQRASVARVLAHQIRRCGVTGDAGPGARRLSRLDVASLPPS